MASIENKASSEVLKIGTRDSELAMRQTDLVVAKLTELYPGLSCEIVSMKTAGDKILDVALSKIGDKSLFLKELEVALTKKEVDIVVHSLKDMPTVLPEGLVIGTVCMRENPADVAVMRLNSDYKSLDALPDGSVIGTSSVRRTAQLKRSHPRLCFESIRGNLNTRFRKLDDNGEKKYAAIVLAAAGVKRMGWKHRISQYLDDGDSMYAVGQGALAIECRESDYRSLSLISSLNDLDTLCCVSAERAFMRGLEGGCSAPLAVRSQIKDGDLTLRGGVWSLDGTRELALSVTQTVFPLEGDDGNQPPCKKMSRASNTYCGLSPPSKFISRVALAHDAGNKLALLMKENGASEILKEAKEANVTSSSDPPQKNGSAI